METKNQFIKDKIIGYSICFFGFFPILPEYLKGLPVVLLSAISLFYFFESTTKEFNYKEFLIQSSLYLISLLSVFYTASFYFPKNKMETTLSLLIVPLAFALLRNNSIKSRYRFLLMWLFIISTSIVSVFSILYYYINGLFTPDLFKVNSFRLLITEIPVICDHPIYISLFLSLAILFSNFIFKRNARNRRILIIVMIIVNIFHLLLLSSKSVIIALTIAIVVQGVLSLKSKLNKIILATVVIGIFILSVIYFPNMERRFREFKIKTTYTELHTTNSSSIRIAIYKCALEKIKNNPIIGYGWGQGEIVLRECYKGKRDYLYQRRFNSHNQYLGYYLDGGLLALFVLLTFIFLQFRFSIIHKNTIFISVLILFSIIMLFENVLHRQSGIIMFIFLIMFFREAKFFKAVKN